MPGRRAPSLLLLGGLLLPGAVLPGAGALEAQEPPASLRPLEPDHWSYRLLEVLDALGRDRAWHPWQAPVSAAAAEGALRGGEGPAGDAVATWRRLFHREAVPAIRAEAGIEESRALPRAERGPFGSVGAQLRAGRRFTLWADAEASRSGGASLRTGGVAFRAGDFQAVAGRLRPALGQGLDPILLGGAAELQGLWLGSARPTAVPGLGFLGRVSGHVFAGPGLETPPSDSVPGGMEAWFLSTAVQLRPHPAVEVALHRTARFAGDSVESATPGRVLEALTVGAPRSDFDDSQGEVALRLRLGVLGVRVAPYLSLGFEDPESLWQDPAVTVGALVPATVGRELVSVRYEYTGFGKRGRWCGGCDYVFHQWYRHRAYGPYTLDGLPLGAFLGGYGSAHRLELQYWSGVHPLRGRAVLFRERRESVPDKPGKGDNLLLDRWPGVRKGARLEVAARPLPGVEVGLLGAFTSTRSGGESGIRLSVRLLDVPGALGR